MENTTERPRLGGRIPDRQGFREGPGGPPTISTFSLVRFLIFSSILWMLCSKSSFFLFMRLFFSTRGFSWTSVSRERFSYGWRETQGQVALGPNGQLSHHIMGAGEIRPGPPSGLELPHPLVTDKELDPKEAGHVLKVTEKVLPPRIEHRG